MASYLDLLKNTTDGIPNFKQNSISELAYLDQVKAPKSFLQQVFNTLNDNYQNAINNLNSLLESSIQDAINKYNNLVEKSMSDLTK